MNTFGPGTQVQGDGDALGEQAIGERQRDFLRRCAAAPISTDELIALGPIASTQWSGVEISDVSFDAERWTAAGLDFLEVSIRVEPTHHDTTEDFEARALELKTRLDHAVDRLGIRRAVNTDNKTLRVLTTLAALVHH